MYYDDDKYVYGNVVTKPRYSPKEIKEHLYNNNEVLKQKRIKKNKAKFAKRMALVMAAIIGMFGFLAFRNSELAKLNYQVIDAQKTVEKLMSEKAELIVERERLVNPDIIRNTATKKLNMRLPTEENKIYVTVPKQDFVISYANEEKQTMLEMIKQNVENLLSFS